MFRKTVVAVIAAALVSSAALSPASAKPWGHWGHHGLGFAFGALGFLAATAAASSAAYTSCLQEQYAPTRHGYKRVLVDVCDY
jgi:4-hydroxybenzoate polyprenyltransferase